MVLLLFYRGTNDGLYLQWRNPDGSWSGEEDLGSVLNGHPVAAQVPGTDVIQAFYRGTDNGVWSRWRNTDGSWSDEQHIGGTLNGDPIAAQVPGTDVLQLFYRGTDNSGWSRWRNTDGSWSAEQSLGGTLSSGLTAAPSAVAPIPISPAPAPASGLGSNSNYLLYSPGAAGVCNNLTGLTVTINVDADITGSDGFGFQVNAHSAKGDYDGAQQYLIYLSPSSSPPQLTCMVDNWQSTSNQLINDQVELATLPSRTLPAGYHLTISLQNDSTGNITGATYVVLDNNGNTVGSQTITLLSVSGVTSADLAPIVAEETRRSLRARGRSPTLRQTR